MWYNLGEMKKNAAIYEQATKSLLKNLDEMHLDQWQRLRAKNLTLLFRDGFKLDYVKHATFYLNIGYDYKKFPYDSYGFCRASSFAFVALMDNPDWQLMYIDDTWTYGPHYFVTHMPTKKTFDLTFDQYLYDGHSVPYYMGRPVKIDPDGKNVVVRFLNSLGVDFTVAAKNIDRGVL